jgi:lipoate-protein ligase A
MKRNHKIAIGVALALSVIAVGGAVGATTLDPREESQAIINDAAEQLGVEPNELSDALKQALKNRVDAAVEDGRLTEEQGERMKERIDANEVPFLGPRLFGPGHPKRLFFHAGLEAAAQYLGMTEAQLRDTLHDGKTLAQVARDRDKSVDGLVDAIVEDAEQRLEEDVETGRLTEAEKREMLEGLRKRTRDLVTGRFPSHPRMQFHRVEPGAVFRPGVF